LYASYDDSYLFNAISLEAVGKEPITELCQMFKERRVLSVAGEAQGMSQNGKREIDYFILDQYSDIDKLGLLSKKSGVPIEWICHNSSRTNLPNLKPIVEMPQEEGEEHQKEMSKALRIVDKNKISSPLANVDNSIVYYLKNMSLDTVRIYTREDYQAKLKTVLDAELKANAK